MTYRHLLTSATALLLATGVAHGQTQSDSSTSGMQSGQGSPSELTCAQISALDTATVPGVLYFISGYSQGQRDGSMGTGTTGSGMSSGSDTSTGTDVGSSTSSTTDTSGATAATSESNGTDSTTAGDTDANASASAGTGGATAEISTITGYFEIPVEQLLIACGADPDRPVSEMLDEEGQRQGGAMSSGSTDGSSTSSDSDTSSDGATSSDSDASSEDTTTTQ